MCASKKKAPDGSAGCFLFVRTADHTKLRICIGMQTQTVMEGSAWRLRLDDVGRYIGPTPMYDRYDTVAGHTVLCSDLYCILLKGGRASKLHAPECVDHFERIAANRLGPQAAGVAACTICKEPSALCCTLRGLSSHIACCTKFARGIVGSERCAAPSIPLLPLDPAGLCMMCRIATGETG